MPVARVNDIRIAYERHGPEDATPLILVQGLSMPLNAWPPVLIERLVSAGFHLVTLDNRDIGESELFKDFGVPNVPWQILKMRLGMSVRSAYRLNDMADDVVGLMDELDIDTAHVAGVSMGGMISQELALGHANRLRSLTSIMSTTGNPRLPQADSEIVRLMITRPKTENTDRRIEHAMKLWRLISSPGFDVDFDYVEQRLRNMYARGVTRGGVVRQMLAIAASGNRAPKLKAVETPSLIIHGRDDRLVPLECGIDTAKSIPGAQLEIIDGMGHDLPLGVLERLSGLITDHAQAAERERKAA
ncbi:MAG: alpha/beta hydrolase [Pseudomonadota bacterium]